MPKKRSSALDFSDSRPSIINDTFEQHLDLADNTGAVHLQRNRTERRRLQGLQRTLTNASLYMAPPTRKNFQEKFNVWLINEGGRQIFFAIWIFLHMLVIAFGFINYQLKDNLVDARATFGITYRAQFSFLVSISIFDTLFFLQPLLGQQLLSFMSMLPLSCCRSVATSSPFYDGHP